MSDHEKTGITRRQLLVTAAASGVTIAGAAWGVSQISGGATRAQYEAELAKWRALVTLYEQLEKVGIDAIIATGMNIVRGALTALKAGVRLLRDALSAIEAALRNFQAALDALKSAANGVTVMLDDLGQKFRLAESFVVGALGVALPLAESILSFFNSLVEKIPFGIGAEVRRAVNGLVDLVRAIPNAIQMFTTQLLAPLRDLFFPPTGKSSVNTNLLDPLAQNLLAPLKKFLDDVDTLLTSWEKDFAAPIQTALDARQKIRAQITAFKQENGIV